MSTSADPTAAVRAALDELHDLLRFRDPRENQGWDVDPATFRRCWSSLETSLKDAAEALHRPQPGQGLASLWLREVCGTAARIEKYVEALPCGWRDLLRHSNANLSWLTRGAREMATELVNGGIATGGISRLLQPRKTSLKRVRELAAEWEAKFQHAPREPKDFERIEVVDRWRPWGEKRDAYILRAGVLILQAVNDLEINVEVLNDASFAGIVLKSLEMPEYLASTLLKEVTPQNLLALVDRLEPAKDMGNPSPRPEDAQVTNERLPRALQVTADESQRPYSHPNLYPRDKWIYEHVQQHEYQTLSKMLEKIARSENWKLITSRNGIKGSADRYAKFHQFSIRRFPDDRVLN